MDAMSGSPSPCRVFAKTPAHATERAESERVSVVVRVIDMLLMLTARTDFDAVMMVLAAREQHCAASSSLARWW